MLIVISILKLIGIILLILLCVIAAIILIISLVPFRYEADVTKYDNILADTKVRWLFKLLKVDVHFNSSQEKDKMHITVKIAGFLLYDNLNPRKKKRKKKKPEKAPAPKPQAEVPASDEVSSQPQSASEEEEAQPAQVSSAEAETHEEIPEPAAPEETEKPKSGHKKKKKKAGKAKRKSESRLSGVMKHKDEIIEMIKDPANQKLVGKILHNLNSLIVKLLPHIHRLFLHFGFDDPAKTGKVMGYLGVAYPLVSGTMELEPEFNKKVMEMELNLQGRIFVIWFIIFAVRSFLNRAFIRLFKKILAIAKDK